MEYINTKEASLKWGITANRITILAKAGRISGAKLIGHTWMIPDDAEKPIDARTKVIKTKAVDEQFFRYPIFEGNAIESFNPPLTDDEITIKKVLEAFHACHFDDAEKLINELPIGSSNQYIRIFAIYCSVMIYILQGRLNLFFESYRALLNELKNEFPHKKEVEVLLHEIDSTLGSNGYFMHNFKVDTAYPYHESFMPRLVALCTLSLYLSDTSKVKAYELNLLETNCRLVDSYDAYVDSQMIHIYLGYIYGMQNKTDKMNYHYRVALQIADKYDLYYSIALSYYYTPGSFSKVLTEFPSEFKHKITALSEDIHKRYISFMNLLSKNHIFKILSKHDYIYVLYASQGYSSKKIAKLSNLSESSVNKKFSYIYEKLNVHSRAELIKCFNTQINMPILKK